MGFQEFIHHCAKSFCRSWDAAMHERKNIDKNTLPTHHSP